MYSISDLQKYEYFSKLLKDNKIEYILDSLTGTVSRKYILDFVKTLIIDKTPFTMAILDLDNFKEINDNYGHATGDRVLEDVGSSLVEYTGENGLVGRFGGDEFIIIIFGHNDYEKIHNFYNDIYHDNRVLRKMIKTGNHEIFITGTIGSSSFPDDGKNYEELFEMSDKTLYRGKVKGRNCYIIYVHEKHKDLQINKLANDDEATIFFNIHSIFRDNATFKDKMSEVNDYLKRNLRLDFLLYIDNNHDLYLLDDLNKPLAKNINLTKKKFNNELLKTDTRDDIRKVNEPLFEATRDVKASSLLITRLNNKDMNYGFLGFGLQRAFKIWKNDEIAALMYFGKNVILDLLN